MAVRERLEVATVRTTLQTSDETSWEEGQDGSAVGKVSLVPAATKEVLAMVVLGRVSRDARAEHAC
jgi:hypothetical protein